MAFVVFLLVLGICLAGYTGHSSKKYHMNPSLKNRNIYFAALAGTAFCITSPLLFSGRIITGLLVAILYGIFLHYLMQTVKDIN